MYNSDWEHLMIHHRNNRLPKNTDMPCPNFFLVIATYVRPSLAIIGLSIIIIALLYFCNCHLCKALLPHRSAQLGLRRGEDIRRETLDRIYFHFNLKLHWTSMIGYGWLVIKKWLFHLPSQSIPLPPQSELFSHLNIQMWSITWSHQYHILFCHNHCHCQ